MTTSMPSARHIAHFAQQVAQVGLPQALRNLGLNDVVGRSAEEVLGVLTDSFCPPGGTIDEAIARDAWNQTIEGVIDQGVTDIAAMTPEQWQGAIAEFITNSIQTKLINDIGTELTRLPTDVAAVDQIQSDLHELVRGSVDDAIGNRLDGGQIMGQADLDGITREIYESAYDYIRDIIEETGNE